MKNESQEIGTVTYSLKPPCLQEITNLQNGRWIDVLVPDLFRGTLLDKRLWNAVLGND